MADPMTDRQMLEDAIKERARRSFEIAMQCQKARHPMARMVAEALAAQSRAAASIGAKMRETKEG